MSNAPEETSRREGRSFLWTAGLLSFLYAATRIGSLDVVPMFLDEAVHIQWAERLYSEGRILRPIGSGRLLAVAAYGLARPFEDRLLGSRLIATAAGGVTLFFTVALARRLFGDRAAFLAGILYVMSPFALVYDRLALSDGFLCAAITGLMLMTFEISLRPSHRGRFWLSVACVALAVMAKVSAALFLVTAPLGAFALSKDRNASLRVAVLALALGLVVASPMLWFFAANSGEISSQHVIDPAIAQELLVSTLRDMRGWALSYFTVPTLIASALSFLALRDGRALWLAGSVALPFLLFALVSQPWSARYVLPTLPPLLILTAGGIEALVSRLKSQSSWLALGFATLVSLPSLVFDWDLLRDPSRAPFPEDDRLQLVTGWPAGYGVRDLAARLKAEAATGPITVFVDSGGLRTVPTSLAVLLGRAGGVSIVEGDFGSEEFRAAMISSAPGQRVLAVAVPRSSPFDFANLVAEGFADRIQVYSRPGGEWAATLFRFKTKH